MSTSCDILYTVFSGNVAKTLVCDELGWWLYLSWAVYEHQTVFSAHTLNGKLADHEEIFSEFDKKNRNSHISLSSKPPNSVLTSTVGCYNVISLSSSMLTADWRTITERTGVSGEC